MIALEVCSNSTTCILLSVFYRPLDADVSLLTNFRDFTNRCSRIGLSDLVVTSDFNYPNIDWNLGCPVVSDPDTEEFFNIWWWFLSYSEEPVSSWFKLSRKHIGYCSDQQWFSCGGCFGMTKCLWFRSSPSHLQVAYLEE